MKKYVFLTQSISGITGNQRYVNNKCKLLRENGWEVIVLWDYNISPVQLEHVKCFDSEKYIHHELKFYPIWFSERGRNKVLDRLVTIVGDADQIVIESNKLELGAWGELLAKKLHCKHINFVTTEKKRIRNKETFDYCYAKLMKNEFFTINEAAVKYLFSNYIEIDNPDNYYWSAMPGVEVEKYAFPVFDNLPKADFTITSFGRRKGYFPYMLEELKLFITHHSDKSFNLFFLGGINDEAEIKAVSSLKNAHVVIYPKEVKVVPQQLFIESDVVVASAGCAWLSAMNGGKTISMDVNRNKPLGLLLYTTLDTNTYSGAYENKKSLSEWLQTILIDKVDIKPIEDKIVLHDYKYQMQFVDNCDYNYIDTTHVKERMTKNDGLYGLLIKMGLFCVVEYFYFKKRGVKIIWR